MGSTIYERSWFDFMKKYWLLKSEPNVWSIDQQKKAGSKGTMWDGVRNYQACNNLKQMKLGDLCFFYHSNIGKEIVGIVEVIKVAFKDPTDIKKYFVAIKVKHKKTFTNPVSLDMIKKTSTFERTFASKTEQIIGYAYRY